MTPTPLEPQDFACEVCTGETGTEPEISRPYPRHFRCKVSQKQPYLRRQGIVPTVLRVHVAVSALLHCEKKICASSNRAVTYFRGLSPAVRRNPAARTPRTVMAKAGGGERAITGVCVCIRPETVSVAVSTRERPFPRVCIRS